MDLSKDIPQIGVGTQAQCHRKITEQQTDAGCCSQVITAVVDPGYLHIALSGADGNGQQSCRNIELVAADHVLLFHGGDMGGQHLCVTEEFAQLIFPCGLIVQLGTDRPVHICVFVFEIAAAFPVEVRLLHLLTLLQAQVVIILFQRHSHISLQHAVHEHLKRGTVKNDVMHIKEQVRSIPSLKQTAAEQGCIDHLKGHHQGIFDLVKFDIADLFGHNRHRHLGIVFLDQLTCLVMLKHGTQGGMVLDRNFQCLCHPISLDDRLVKTEHGKQVVHGGVGRIVLIIEHIALFSRQLVGLGFCRLVQSVIGFGIAVPGLLHIQPGDTGCGTAAENAARIQAGQTALYQQLHRSQGVAAHFVEIIIHADAVQTKDGLHGIAQGFLHFVGGCLVGSDNVLELGLGQCGAVHLAVGLDGDLIDLDEMGRDHVVRQTLLQTGPQFSRIEGNVVLVISADKLRFTIGKASDRTPFDIQSRADSRFDLSRLDTVAVDLDHVALSAADGDIAIGQHLHQIAAVEVSIPENLCSFFGEVDVAAHVGILKDKLTDLAVGYRIAFLVDDAILQIELRLADGAHIVFLIDDEHAGNKAALTLGIHVEIGDALQIEVVGRLTAHDDLLQEGTGLAGQLSGEGGRDQEDGDALAQQVFHKGQGIFHRGKRKDVGFVAAAVQDAGQDHDGGDEVQGNNMHASVAGGDHGLALVIRGLHTQLQIAVLMQDTLGISGGAGSIDRKSGIVGIGLLIAIQGLAAVDLFPHITGNGQLTAAVTVDIVNTLRSHDLLRNDKCCACSPYADHGDDGLNAAGQFDQNKVFLADVLRLQVCINTAADDADLFIAYAFGIFFIVEGNHFLRVCAGHQFPHFFHVTLHGISPLNLYLNSTARKQCCMFTLSFVSLPVQLPGRPAQSAHAFIHQIGCQQNADHRRKIPYPGTVFTNRNEQDREQPHHIKQQHSQGRGIVALRQQTMIHCSNLSLFDQKHRIKSHIDHFQRSNIDQAVTRPLGHKDLMDGQGCSNEQSAQNDAVAEQYRHVFDIGNIVMLPHGQAVGQQGDGSCPQHIAEGIEKVQPDDQRAGQKCRYDQRYKIGKLCYKLSKRQLLLFFVVDRFIRFHKALPGQVDVCTVVDPQRPTVCYFSAGIYKKQWVLHDWAGILREWGNRHIDTVGHCRYD